MLRSKLLTITFSLAVLLPACSAVPQRSAAAKYSTTSLMGMIGSSPRWGSGWLDLASPVDFKRGDRLRLALGGSAKKVVVRLLVKGADPDTPAGVIRPIKEVPDSGIIEITVPSDFPHVVQVSVHGLANPWKQFSLGSGNGPATLLQVEKIGTAD